jgi:hypothetical protein
MSFRGRCRLKWYRLRYRVWSNPSLSRRNADSIFILFGCMFSGAAQLVTRVVAPSIQEGLGDPWALIWTVALLLFGACAFLGVFYKDNDIGLILESAGRFGLFSFSMMYAILVFKLNILNAIVPALFTGMFALACLARALHITFWIQQRKHIHALSAE